MELRIIVLCLCVTLGSGYLCPPGWLPWKDNCYFISSHNSPRKTWHQASLICNQLQADLLSIESQEEYDWLAGHLNQITVDGMVQQQWWTGLSDEKTANTWRWSSTGKPISANTTLSWVVGYPKDHSESECKKQKCNRCALINTRLKYIPKVVKDSYIRGLTEQSCIQPNPYICKRANITELPSKCEYADGWLQVGKACWKLFTDRKLSWYEARDYCQETENGQLASVHSMQEQTTLLTVANDNFDRYWIGLQVNKSGSIVDGLWTDGSVLSHDAQDTFWAAQQPDFVDMPRGRGCVHMDNADVIEEGWHIGHCYTDMSFICQRPQGVCPPGWATINGRCYELNLQIKQSWEGASKHCIEQNASLMEIDTDVERQFLTNSRYMFDLDIDAVWIGFREFLGAYRWLSGGKVNSSLYILPDGLAVNNRKCGLLYGDSDGNMSVTDNCAKNYPFICEGRADDSLMEYTHPPVDTFCEPSYFQYKGRCYRMNSDSKTFDDARKACISEGGTLATLTNSQEQAFINSHTSQIYWIGLSNWGNDEGWRWVDASVPNTYRNFISTYHKLLKSGRNCVYIIGRPGGNQGQWFPGPCNVEFPYICEKAGTKVKVSPTTPPPLDPDCGEDWRTPVLFAADGSTPLNYCYQLNKEARVWAEAQIDCETKGGQLASITTPYEQTTVENYIPYKLPGVSVWLGGSDKTTNSAWGWIDSNPFSYVNWDGLRLHTKSLLQCIAMNVESKQWMPEDCNNKKAYVCKKPKMNQFTTTTPTPLTTTIAPGMMMGCPDSYQLIGSNCYKLYTKAATQKVAKDTCTKDGASLASVRNELENINELKYAYKNKGQNLKWWIGLEDRDNNGVYSWVDKTPVEFVDWGSHQPAHLGYLRCVAMSQKGQWEVMSCETVADGFICKTSPNLVRSTNPADMSKLCPPMTTHMSDSACYLAAFSHFNWQGAKDSCGLNNFELASFDSPEEAAYILDIYDGTGAYNFWVGYQNVNGSYLWKGLPVETSSFLPQWNKDHTGNEYNNCTYVKTRTGQLYDGDCTTRLPFICKTYRLDHKVKPSQQETTCPNKWHLAGDKCYHAFQNYRRPYKKSWYAARQHCIDLGGDLASLHYQLSDDKSLKSIFSNQFSQVQKSEYWLGLNRLDRSKGYRWSDGSNVDWTMWAEGEPNDNQLIESCVVAAVMSNYNSPVKLEFNDKYCATAHDYICQLPAGTTTATVKPTTTLPTPSRIPGVQGQCDPGWLEFATKCYKFKMDYLSWHEAKSDCEEEGGHLAVIHSLKENDFILSQITRTSHQHWAIGLTEYRNKKWGWVDGTALDFTPWHEGEPSDHGGAEACAEIYHDSGFWNDYNCAVQTRGHICQRPLNGHTLPATTTGRPASGNCQDGFQSFDGRCFGLFGQHEPLSWRDAQDTCRSYGLGYDLASIMNGKQQAFVGLTTYESELPVWIGFSDLTGFGRFTWSNNDPIVSTHWAQGQPERDTEKKGRCIQVETDVEKRIGLWKSSGCTIKLPYLCSGPLDPSIADPVTTASSLCRSGYKEFNNQCYKIFTSPLNFDDAADSCYGDGMGYLTSVLNAREQSYLEVLLASSNTKLSDVWIGMKREEYVVDDREVGQYEWQDRFPVKYSKWMPGQPKHIDEVPNCVSMNASNGRWASVDCDPSVTKPYICKISTEPRPTYPSTRVVCDSLEAINYRGMCYTFHTPKYGKDWGDASAECASEGMSLASIHDADTQEFFTAMILDSVKPMYVWIGLVKAKYGGYVWSDQSEMQYEQWGPGEPAQRLEKQTDACGFLKIDNQLSPQYGANWTADRCYANKGWICQSPGHLLTAPTTSSTTTIPTTTVKQYCDGDRNWKYYNGSCYYVSDERISWHDSNAKCKGMGAELASIHGDDEFEAILKNKRLGNYITAIGLTRLGLRNWEWVDGTLIDYKNWLDGEPNNHDDSERCAFMFTFTKPREYIKGKWNDQHCGTLGGYVCKRPEHPLPTTKNPAILTFLDIGNCPSSWGKFGNKCYGLFTDKLLNWTDARNDCREKGINGDLVSIHSVKEQAFITSQLWDLDDNVWIGLSDRFWNNHFWWSNNDRVQYTNWAMNEPNQRASQNCVEMMLHEISPGKWRDEDCSLKQHYICSSDKDPRISSPPTVAPIELCPEGYTYYQFACYKLYSNKVGYGTADVRCNKDNANVVSIISPYEQAFVEALLVFENKPVWIGLVELERDTGDNLKSDRFLWEDGWPVEYTLWDDGMPTPTDNNSPRCVTLNPLTSKWKLDDCYMSHSFVCKQSKVKVEPTPPAMYRCSEGEINYENKCFKLGTKGKQTWSQSHMSCLQMGMEMASFHSYDEGAAVMRILYDSKNVGNIWLGLIRNVKGGFYWMDKTPVDWTYWSRNEPDNKFDNEACVEMVWSDNGRWNDVNCGALVNYLCERPAEAFSTTPSTTTKAAGTAKTTHKIPAIKIKTAPQAQTTAAKSPRASRTTTAAAAGSAGRRRQTSTATASDVPLIVGVLVPILVIVIGAAVILYARYRRSRMAGTDVSGARYQRNDAHENGGSLKFTNKLYEQNISGTESMDMNALSNTPGITVP